ncbi:hypothetical protein C1646_699480 [Rhizophagus diaphanus]|nr:hypothetical protein C1646_699480 [Rhizophagus diaphanus] [Rhizophagus sp. MUCL 43196]
MKINKWNNEISEYLNKNRETSRKIKFIREVTMDEFQTLLVCINYKKNPLTYLQKEIRLAEIFLI